jgi:hypothetical protein
MIIVLDTNIWKQELYLYSGAGAALKLYLNRKGATVALPEVIRLEVEAHLRADVQLGSKEVSAAHNRLVALFGSLRGVQLPTDDQIEILVSRFISDTGLTIREVPFTLESARDSFLRTIDKRPPSSTSQQFKDGVIWADCKALALEDEVVLVTADTAFYRNRKPAEGLDQGLAREIQSLPHALRVIPKLGDLLDLVRTELRVDNKTLISAIMESPLGADLRAHAGADELTLGAPTISASYFATENPSQIFIDFEINVLACDETLEQKGAARLVLTGGCMLNERTGEIGQFAPRELRLAYLPPSAFAGQESIFRYGIGSTERRVKHQVREPLG